ncbi:MAG: hypothetical protein EAZ96_15405 [Oscillatoriales cyanobacterium]|nr:MAG: hypothetical protein EAZ96_15405 [Oscillatoriales cyanobacterium]
MWAIYGIVGFLVLDYRSFFVWSIAHMTFLATEEILDQREVGIGWVCAIERTNDIKLSDLTEINTESVQIMQNRAIAFSSRY